MNTENQDGKKRDPFFEYWGITPEEEEFFKVLYKRRQIYRGIIGIAIIAIIAILIALLCAR